MLANTACAVGNSSSFVRDASYFGTPVVLVGNRQDGRETDSHVKFQAPAAQALAAAVRAQLLHGPYEPSTLYGDGRVSAHIAEALASLEPYAQKRLHYIYDTPSTSTDAGGRLTGEGPNGARRLAARDQPALEPMAVRERR